MNKFERIDGGELRIFKSHCNDMYFAIEELSINKKLKDTIEGELNTYHSADPVSQHRIHQDMMDCEALNGHEVFFFDKKPDSISDAVDSVIVFDKENKDALNKEITNFLELYVPYDNNISMS